jgi:hypothetical protein
MSHVSQRVEEGRGLGNQVELVAVEHQNPAAVRGGEDGLADQTQLAELLSQVVQEEVVVIADDVMHLTTVLGEAEHLAHGIVVVLRPVRSGPLARSVQARSGA